MLIGVLVLYALGAVLALLASVGVGPFGPFEVHNLALAFVAAGLCACHVPGVHHHV